jgi:hypothetical protein
MNLLKKDNIDGDDRRRARKLMREMQLVLKKQMGTVRKVQDANEQALLNISMMLIHGNNLKTGFQDVKKAFCKEIVCLLCCLFCAWTH